MSRTFDFSLTHPIQIEVSLWSDADADEVEISITDENGWDGAKVPLGDVRILFSGDEKDCYEESKKKMINTLKALIARIEASGNEWEC